jgi:hypothetical protein
VWRAFGDVNNYVEPFFGSGAVLLRRPAPFGGTETVNDADGLVANFWRALRADPEGVATFADWPVNENDMHARHAWLVGRKDPLQARLEGDPDYFDPKVAGWWAWGVSCWIGSGFCSGRGPWRAVEAEDGSRQLRRTENAGQGVNRQLVHLGNTGQGVNRQRVHLGDAGRGVNRKRVHLGDAGRGVNRQREGHSEALREYFAALAKRLRHVRVCCGDWARVCGDTPMFSCGRSSKSYRVGVFLDPPYADTAKRDGDLYRKDCLQVAHAVREWAIARGDDPRYRIVLCGYEGEHVMPDSWQCVEGKAGRGFGYGGQSKAGYANTGRERIWLSPHCLDSSGEGQLLFGAVATV